MIRAVTEISPSGAGAGRRFRLEPRRGPERATTTEVAIAYCHAHPRWRLSLQTH